MSRDFEMKSCGVMNDISAEARMELTCRIHLPLLSVVAILLVRRAIGILFGGADDA